MIETPIIVLMCTLYVLLVAFLTIRLKGFSIASIILKAITSLTFIAVLITCNHYHALLSTTSFILILVGGIFGLFGDVLLDIKHFYEKVDALMLNLGFLAFGIGHCCYFAAAAILSNSINAGNILWPVLAGIGFGIVCVILDILGTKMFKLQSQKFTIQSNVYLFVLAFMTGAAICLSIMNSHFVILAVGMGLFLFSDVVLCFVYFAEGQKHNKAMIIINHVTYYTAQLLIALLPLAFII